jgi:hypothetical protein
MGWDEGYRENASRKELFLQLLTDSTKTYFNGTKLNFNDILDNLIVVYVISQELEAGLNK